MDPYPPNHFLYNYQEKYDGNVLIEFFNHVPNVKNLTLQQICDPDLLQIIASNLNQLETLTVNAFDESMYGGIKFHKLASLTIQRLIGKINWDGRTKGNPLLTQLTIEVVKNAAFLNSHDIRTIFKNLNLQTLRIGSGITVDAL